MNHGGGVTDADSLMSLVLPGDRLRQASSSHSLKSMHILTTPLREEPGAIHLQIGCIQQTILYRVIIFKKKCH